MDIDGTPLGNVEHSPGQYQSVGCDRDDVRPIAIQLLLKIRVLQSCGSLHRDAARLCQLLDRRCDGSEPSTSATIRSGQHADDVVPGLKQRLEAARGEFRRARKSYLQQGPRVEESAGKGREPIRGIRIGWDPGPRPSRAEGTPLSLSGNLALLLLKLRDDPLAFQSRQVVNEHFAL